MPRVIGCLISLYSWASGDRSPKQCWLYDRPIRRAPQERGLKGVGAALTGCCRRWRRPVSSCALLARRARRHGGTGMSGRFDFDRLKSRSFGMRGLHDKTKWGRACSSHTFAGSSSPWSGFMVLLRRRIPPVGGLTGTVELESIYELLFQSGRLRIPLWRCSRLGDN